MNFYDEILQAVYDCLFDSLVIKDETDARFAAKQNTANPVQVRSPNFEYFTPLWQVLLRPIRPQDVTESHLAPSAFIRIAQGTRSARGQGLQDSPVRGVIGDISEDYSIGIQAVFKNEFGPPDPSVPSRTWRIQLRNAESNVAPSNVTIAGNSVESVTGDGEVWILTLQDHTSTLAAADVMLTGLSNANNGVNAIQNLNEVASPLSNQINGFITDLDKCLSVFRIRQMVTNNDVNINDAYITDWVAQEDFDGTGDQIVTAILLMSVNFRRLPDAPTP